MFNILYLLLCCMVLSCNAFRCDNRAHKRGESANVQKWPANTVPYEFDEVYTPSERQLIDESLKELTSRTGNCVKFVPRNDNHPVWMRIASKDGCWAPVGMPSGTGAKTLSLDRSGCLTQDTVIHEFLHTLGFVHEQTRPDRDSYVKILVENVQPVHMHNFEKNPQGELQSFGLPYDYNSIMHYTYNSFSTNGLPTMVTTKNDAKSWRYTMGTGNKLTDNDIYKVKKIYGCE